MAWLKIDDGFNENPKIERLRDRAFRVHVSALVYCAKNLTDGHVSVKSGKVIAILVGFPIKRHVLELVDACLWTEDEAGDGHWINDYLVYNPSADEVKKLRDERSQAGKRGAKKRWSDGNSYGNSHRQVPDAPVVARPSPSREHLKAVTADQEKQHEVDKILRSINNADGETRNVLMAYAAKLPLASIAKVRESCATRKVGAGYAVRALQSELAELEDVA